MTAKRQPDNAPELKPAREQRTLPIEGVKWERSGSANDELTVRGHASVYDRLSLDLGGFRERIAKGAFNNVLDRNPDVHALWDHDTSKVLARTKSKTLELREDPIGLHFWAKVANTSYARDLKVLMERGDVDQASFAFTVANDVWEVDENEEVTRTITEIGELYDVTVTAQGAYPQTDTSVVAHMRSRLQQEVSEGNLPQAVLDKIVAPEGADEPAPQENLDAERNLAPKVGDDSSHTDVDEEKRVTAREREKLLDEMAAAVAEEKERKRGFERNKYALKSQKER